MAPKKSKAAATSDSTTEATAQGFRWTPENDRKLLILVHGRVMKGEDYVQLLTAFPGTNLNGVKIRVSRIRGEQRKLYEELGWNLPESSTVKKGDKKGEEGGGLATKGKKRGANETSGAMNNGESVKKAKKAEKTEDDDEGVIVKEEDLENEED